MLLNPLIIVAMLHFGYHHSENYDVEVDNKLSKAEVCMYVV